MSKIFWIGLALFIFNWVIYFTQSSPPIEKKTLDCWPEIKISEPISIKYTEAEEEEKLMANYSQSEQIFFDSNPLDWYIQMNCEEE
jgi:hypothetical protein